MDKADELELRKEITAMRKDMSEGFLNLSVQLAQVATKQNIGVGIFKFAITVVVASISGLFGAHLTK